MGLECRLIWMARALPNNPSESNVVFAFTFAESKWILLGGTTFVFFRYQDMNISACTSGRGQLILSDHEGALYFLDRQMELKMFRAYEIRVSHLHQMKQHNILVTVGVSICEFKKWGLWPVEKPVLSGTDHMLIRHYTWQQNIKYLNYRPQRSCEGYVFTGVCLSTGGGGGWYPSMPCRWYPSMPCSRSSGGCYPSMHCRRRPPESRRLLYHPTGMYFCLNFILSGTLPFTTLLLRVLGVSENRFL